MLVFQIPISAFQLEISLFQLQISAFQLKISIIPKNTDISIYQKGCLYLKCRYLHLIGKTPNGLPLLSIDYVFFFINFNVYQIS